MEMHITLGGRLNFSPFGWLTFQMGIGTSPPLFHNSWQELVSDLGGCCGGTSPESYGILLEFFTNGLDLAKLPMGLASGARCAGLLLRSARGAAPGEPRRTRLTGSRGCRCRCPGFGFVTNSPSRAHLYPPVLFTHSPIPVVPFYCFFSGGRVGDPKVDVLKKVGGPLFCPLDWD